MNEEIDEQKEYIKKIAEENSDKSLKYTILTMGCQLNENDSEKISGMLDAMRYIKTEKFEEANLVIINTCCVRENAEERLFGKVGELKNLKQKNNMIIAIGRMYDARKTHGRKNKKVIPTCRHCIWNTYNT